MKILFALSFLVLARPGPDTATRVAVAEPQCSVKASMDGRRCPEPVVCEIAHDLPDPGHSIAKSKATVDRKNKRIRIDLTMKRKPGSWAQVIVPTRTKVEIGVLRKGRYVVEVHRNDRLLHAFVLEGR